MSMPPRTEDSKEVVLPVPGYDELVECSVCKWQDGGAEHITRDELRRGSEQACTFCGVVLDAYMTCNEFAQKQMDFMNISVPFLDDENTIGAILLLPALQDRLFKWLEVFRNQDAEKAQALPKWAKQLKGLRLPSGDTSSIKSLSTLKAWLDTCERDHTCIETKTGFMPERVIELTRDLLFLREDLVGDHKYACLSHCWGTGRLAFKLLEANKHEFFLGFSAQQLPKTFQDAVEICRFLGIRFLWIDALCIVQDDIKDWSKSAAAMAEIYRYSFITIAASAARNSHEGCFWITSETATTIPLRYTPALMTRPNTWSEPPQDMYANLMEDPLLRRAWVYQERRMSRRMVHFASAQLVWECQHYITGENSATIDKRQTQRTVQVPDAVLPTSRILAWQKTVQEYSALELTFESDRLPAIAALAQEEMRLRPNDTYVCGMWKNTLVQDLLWHSLPNTSDYISDKGKRPTKSSPSWSWPSVKGQVMYHAYDPLPTAQIVDLAFTPDGPPQLGGYREASIILRGPSTEAVFGHPVPYYRMLLFDLSPGRSGNRFIALPPYLHAAADSADFDFSNGHEFDQFLFVFLGFENDTCWGLILRERLDEGYERVGICTCYCHDRSIAYEEGVKLVQSYIDSLTVREVKIV